MKQHQMWKIYLVETEKYIYTGTFLGLQKVNDGYSINYVIGCFMKKYKCVSKPPKKINYCKHFSIDCILRDVEEIIVNGKKARQNMEQRALDIILKRLVNENFQW
jgi:hypothetical protein